MAGAHLFHPILLRPAFATQRQVKDLGPDIDVLSGKRDGMKLRIRTPIPKLRGRFIHDLAVR